jgi:hypothetical protein
MVIAYDYLALSPVLLAIILVYFNLERSLPFSVVAQFEAKATIVQDLAVSQVARQLT